jgi:hypothetical protein
MIASAALSISALPPRPSRVAASKVSKRSSSIPSSARAFASRKTRT